MNAIKHGRTMFIVAHRLSTIKKYSRTVVMNKGQIVEIGSHDDEKLDPIYEVKIEPNGEKITVRVKRDIWKLV